MADSQDHDTLVAQFVAVAGCNERFVSHVLAFMRQP